jgi:hypothetical protein
MGGNALAPFGARRYKKEEYVELRNKVIHVLEGIVPEGRVWEIPYYWKKDSFGDLDLLVYSLEPEHYSKIIVAAAMFNGDLDMSVPLVRNSDVLSIMFEQLQVDIIPMPQEDFITAYTYYAFNDLGNLVGKLFHKFGLKYGHRGLTYPMRDGDNQYDEIMVSKDARQTFGFLGLSYAKWAVGFDTLDEIFEFVTSSPYFSSVPFQYENLNHTNRIRDRKRTTYHAFLEYIKDKPCTYDFHEDKSAYLDAIFDYFPGFEEKYIESRKKLEHRLKVKEHFNGEMASEWTGFKGMRLGKFMHRLKDKRGEFAKWVLDYSPVKLKEIVLDEAQTFWDNERISSLDLPKRNFRDDNQTT